MQARVLLIDSIPVNRVSLKVTLSAAWYDVVTATGGEEALTLAQECAPNLIVVNSALPDINIRQFIARLRAALGRDTPPVLALTDGAETREGLLRDGAESVIHLPVSDHLMLARIRSMLRNAAAEAEWRLRDVTSRALGFAEPAQAFDHGIPVVALVPPQVGLPECLRDLSARPDIRMTQIPLHDAMRMLPEAEHSAVIVLVLAQNELSAALPGLSDLRANPATRHAAILAIAPQDCQTMAAQALDLGADDADTAPMAGSELALRVKRAHARSKINESLRATMRDGVEAAIRDPLTRLYNRRYAMPYLDRVAERAQQSGRPYAVMIADLDHFKQVNDWHGHATGDAILRDTARRLLENMRARDLVARLGGEEFLIVLPDTNLSAARKAALRLCKRIAETPFKVQGSKEPISVTISIGLALSQPDQRRQRDLFLNPERPEKLLERADRALYRAKEMGRNRFILEREAA